MTDQELQQQYGGLATSTAPTATAPSSALASYTPQASQVYSPTNVQQTMTAPASAPNYADPFALRDYFYNTPDVVNARKAVQDLTAQLNTFDTGQQKQQNYLENQTVAMPVITGEQANQARLGATQREAIARDLLARQSFLDTATNEANQKYQIAQEQRGQLQSLISQTGGKAGISYADTYDQAVAKADSYLTKKAEDTAKEARKQAEKDALRNLYLQTFGTTPKKGMSTKDIQKKLGQTAKEKKAFQDKLNQLELQTKQTTLATARQTLSQSTTQSQSNTALANASSALLASRGTDGKVDPNTYIAQRDNYLRTVKGATPTAFDTQFGTLLSGDEQGNLGVSTASTRATKQPTQAQQTVAGYASRMKQSQDIINSLENVGSSVLGYAAQYMPNILKTGERQKLEQAQRDFTNAILRKESGAAISSSEFDNASRQYFPQPGDSPQVVAQKRANRENAIQGLVNASGNATINGASSDMPSLESQIQEMKNAGYSQDDINSVLGQ